MIDEQAYELAKKTLSKGRFDATAYIVMDVAERRLKQADKVPESNIDESIDSFGAYFVEYAKLRGTDAGYLSLRKCLEVGIATFSELLASTYGDEKQAVRDACEKIGNLI